MSIVYASVTNAKGSVSAFNGPTRPDVSDLVSKILQQVDLTVDAKKSYSSKGYTFNYVTDQRACYMCVADEAFARRLCFGFLERIRTENVQKGKVGKSFLETEMAFWSTNPEADKIRSVQKQVEDVKDIMMENIDKILQRGEKLEDIDRKAGDLAMQSETFHKRSKKLKCELFKKNIKLTICIAIIVLIILIGIALGIYFAVKR